MAEPLEPIEGGCLCGAVRYRISAEPQAVLACHCRQCRRLSGHYFAATAAPRDTFELVEERSLAWFASSETSKRGFCTECGSSLFFERGPDEPVGIAAGSLDGDPKLAFAAHIYVDEAGGYYEIPEDGPHFTREDWLQGGWKRYRS